MKIDEILDLMDQLLDHAKPIPFASHKVIVDGDRLRELINDMRMNKPEEIRRAKLIEFDCDRIIQEAQTNGERHALINRTRTVSPHEFTRGTTNEKSDSQPKKIKKESLHKSFILNLTFVHLSLL